MTVNLSMFAGVGQQFFDNYGVPLTGGKIYTYAAGTTTPQATYTTSAGSIAHPNPIVLDSSGRVPSGGEIWLTDAVSYKFVVETSTSVLLNTFDNVTGNGSGILASLAASSGSSLVGFIASGANAVARTVQSKLRDVINVKDFGAVGDGIANDRDAIQAALNSVQAGQKLILEGVFKVVNATGGGATIVDQRANAVANNTLYAITSNVDDITIQIDGIVNATSALDDVFRFTGKRVTVCGSGTVAGPDIYLDTNSTNPLLQWYPSLVKLSGDGSVCTGLTLSNPPTIGVYLNSNYSQAIGNSIVGGPTVHGTGTVLFGICLGNTAGGNKNCSAVGNNIYPNAGGGCVYDAVYSVAANSVISDNTGYGLLEHGVYNYGSYSVIANNVLSGATSNTMDAAGIQSFAANCVIANNTISYAAGGIEIAACSNTEVTGNVISTGIDQTGITVRRYYADATSTTYKNITISNNTVNVLGITQQAIDIAMDNSLTGLIVSNNTVTGSAATYGAIIVRNAGSGTVNNISIVDNYIQDCDSFAIELRGIQNFIVSRNQIVNPNATTSNIGIFTQTNCVNGIVKNNQVVDTRSPALTTKIFFGSGAGNNYITVSENSSQGLLTTTDAFVVIPATGAKFGNTQNGVPTTGTFTVTNTTGATVTAGTQTAFGGGTPILLLPLNQAAFDLQAGANRIYVSSVAAGSFNWATSSGAATGSTTAQFQYQIIQ